jgi:hypothetical protein
MVATAEARVGNELSPAVLKPAPLFWFRAVHWPDFAPACVDAPVLRGRGAPVLANEADGHVAIGLTLHLEVARAPVNLASALRIAPDLLTTSTLEQHVIRYDGGATPVYLQHSLHMLDEVQLLVRGRGPGIRPVVRDRLFVGFTLFVDPSDRRLLPERRVSWSVVSDYENEHRRPRQANLGFSSCERTKVSRLPISCS